MVQYEYDLDNRLTQKTFSTGAVVSYEYYANGKLKNVTDPKGAVTQYEYYDNNWLQKVIFADGNQVTYEYIESGDLVKVNLPNGSSVEYEYFLDHSIKKVTLPDDSTRQTAYDLYGNIRTLTDGRGNSVQFRYDTLQQLADSLKELDGVEKSTEYEYNKNGDLVKVTDARGNSTEFLYDKAGNVRQVNYPDGTSERSVFDAAGNLIEHYDGKDRKTAFQYDENDRLYLITLHDGSTVRYHFDKNGNITERDDHFADTAHKDTVTLYQYDSNNRPIRVVCRDSSGKTLYQHKSAYDFTNLTTNFSDIFGPQYGSGVKYAGANIIGETEGAYYDHIYKFSPADGSGVKPLKYGSGDAQGLLYGEDVIGEPGEITGESDISGRAKYGMGTKTSNFSYDNLSRITEYSDLFGNKYYYGYDQYSRLAMVRYPNNIFTGYEFDEAGRLNEIRHERMESDGTRTLLESFTYTYDLNGNITRITRADTSCIDYTYDEWNRLTCENWKDSGETITLQIDYSFDSEGVEKYGDTGNICSKTVTRNGGSPETTSFVYDSYNKLMGITFPDSTTETLSYDDNGQLVRREKSTGEVTRYEWNDQGMLVKVILPNGEPVKYFYDGDNRLVGRESSEGYNEFVQSGWDIVEETDDTGRRTYFTGLSAVKEESNDGTEYFHYNHRGDTVLKTDKDGNVLSDLTYEAYGKPTDSNGIPANEISLGGFSFLYNAEFGIRYDRKTKLHYMRNRWYSGEQMRFISADLRKSVNQFCYVNGNPVNFIDPYGLDLVKITIYKDIHRKKSESFPVGKYNIKATKYINSDNTFNTEEYDKFLLAQMKNRYSAVIASGKYDIENLTQNCHGLAHGGAQGIYLPPDNAEKILNSSSYFKVTDSPLNEGDLLLWRGSDGSLWHTATVFYRDDNMIWIIETDGFGPVFILPIESARGVWGNEGEVYRATGVPPTLTFEENGRVYQRDIYPYELIRKKYSDYYKAIPIANEICKKGMRNIIYDFIGGLKNKKGK